MDADTLRSLQAPIKDRYRNAPNSAVVVITGTPSDVAAARIS